MPTKPRIDPDYRRWQQSVVRLRDTDIIVASKPGVFAHGAGDPASNLLAEHVVVDAGADVALMNCGNGLVLSALGAGKDRLGRHGRLMLTDRNVLATEAAARSIVANGIDRADVRLGHGSLPLGADARCDVVVIRIPLEKTSLLQLLRDAHAMLTVGGTCYIAGATNEGIKSAATVMERLFGSAITVATDAGHRVVRATKYAVDPAQGDDVGDPVRDVFLEADSFHEIAVTLRGEQRAIFTRPGVFSWDHLDEASALLGEHMLVRPSDRVLDLGCGAGILGLVAGSLAPDGSLTLVDADAEAVRSATRTMEYAGLRNARVMISDVASAVLDERFDLVVTNPPFHVGKTTDLSVPMQFIEDAWATLAPGGRLNLVANRTLPYEGAIRWRFGNIATVHDGRRFKVLSAVKH